MMHRLRIPRGRLVPNGNPTISTTTTTRHRQQLIFPTITTTTSRRSLTTAAISSSSSSTTDDSDTTTTTTSTTNNNDNTTTSPQPKIPKVHITLFSRTPCGLCIKAKNALSHTWDIRPESFVYREVDVMGPEAEREGWKVYEFDTPVLHIEPNPRPAPHPTKTPQTPHKSGSTILRKLMHRFTAEDILREMAFVERQAARTAGGGGFLSAAGEERGQDRGYTH
ncbi:hypothetical protein DFH27DRAFT_534532 [Peziza echinospora]|nr:hypothetical protein DFH27DRAFT_534532 [Peziza echinospora]